MTTVEKNILDTYSGLFDKLDSGMKKELLSRLVTLPDNPEQAMEDAFYKSFGAFPDDKTAEQIIDDIKESRAFRSRRD